MQHPLYRTRRLSEYSSGDKRPVGTNDLLRRCLVLPSGVDSTLYNLRPSFGCLKLRFCVSNCALLNLSSPFDDIERYKLPQGNYHPKNVRGFRVLHRDCHTPLVNTVDSSGTVFS